MCVDAKQFTRKWSVATERRLQVKEDEEALNFLCLDAQFNSYMGAGGVANALTNPTLEVERRLQKDVDIALPELTFSTKEIDVKEWEEDILVVNVLKNDMMSLSLPQATMVNCAEKTGAKNLYRVASTGY
eukprot:Gb_40533 [translate_table: standard]